MVSWTDIIMITGSGPPVCTSTTTLLIQIYYISIEKNTTIMRGDRYGLWMQGITKIME